MQNNAMKKCAVGAMLFGGTLGLSQSASAAVVTFLSTAPGSGPYNAYSYTTLTTSGTGNQQTDTGSFSSSGSASLVTAFSQGSGATLRAGNTTISASWTAGSNASWANVLTLSASKATTFTSGSTNNGTVSFQRVFTVSGGSADYSFNLTNNGGATFGIEANLYNVSSSTGEIDYTSTVFSYANSTAAGASFTASGTGATALAAGTYALSGIFFLSANTPNAQFMTFNIPAPGAAALVGMAGLITSRRRKA